MFVSLRDTHTHVLDDAMSTSTASRVAALLAEPPPAPLALVAPAPEAEATDTDRPQTLDEFVGNPRLIGRMSVWLDAAEKLRRPPSHAVFFGPPGCGKTSLAAVVANRMGSRLISTTGSACKTVEKLGAYIGSIREGDILFIDEGHRMSTEAEEALGLAMEDRTFTFPARSRVRAEATTIDVPPFTLIIGTTALGQLSDPFLDRLKFKGEVVFYTVDELTTVILRKAEKLKLDLTEGAARMLATRSRGTPRVAGTLLSDDVLNYAVAVKDTWTVTEELVAEAMALAEIDELGLTPLDRRVLMAVARHFAGGPIGVGPLVTYLRGDHTTITKKVDPWLFQLKMLVQQSDGRVATKLAYRHLRLLPIPVYIKEPEQD